jgi:sugar lactone lactonase YvrE
LVRVLEPNAHGLCPLAYSASGKILATFAGHDQICLWDLAAGEKRGHLKLKHDLVRWVNALAFSPDGKMLASGYALADDKGALSLWNIDTGELRREVRVPDYSVDALSFSPDGKILAVLGRSWNIYLWDVDTIQQLRKIDSDGKFIVSGLAFSPDAKTLASGRTAVRLWDVFTGKRLRQFEGWGPPDAFSSCVAFSPDGSLLAVGGGFPRPMLLQSPPERRLPIICIWDVATGRQRPPLQWQAEGAVSSLAFSPDGKTLASGGPDQARLWEVATGKERRLLGGHQKDFFTVAFSPDGRTLATSSGDNRIRIWDATGWWHDIEPSPKELEAQWAELASSDATKGYRAFCTLAHWPEHTVPFLKERLRPIPKAQAQRIARLITDLDSPQFAIRQRATAELEQLGDAAEPALQHVLAGQPSLEVRQRAERLLAKLRAAPVSGERLRVLRAMEVLEYIGTPAVRPVLESLARGAPEDQLTQEAKASLKRLTKRWGAAP